METEISEAWFVVPTSVQCAFLLLIFLCSCVFIFNTFNFLSSDSIRMATDGTPLDLALQNVTISMDGKSCSLSYIEVDPVNEGRPNILLLHGQKFSASTWNKETGTMSKLKEWGYRAVAVNLRDDFTAECTNGQSEAKGVLLHELVKTLKLQKVVVVSPSMSGEFSIPHIIEDNYSDGISAYIPIAPVILPKYTEELFQKVKVKTLILQGENDKLSIAERSMKLLAHIPNSEVILIPDAGHPCYLNQPIVWHQHLKAFLDKL